MKRGRKARKSVSTALSLILVAIMILSVVSPGLGVLGANEGEVDTVAGTSVLAKTENENDAVPDDSSGASSETNEKEPLPVNEAEGETNEDEKPDEIPEEGEALLPSETDELAYEGGEEETEELGQVEATKGTQEETKEIGQVEGSKERQEEKKIVEETNDTEQMLDGFPATKHPKNPTPITRFAAGSLGPAISSLTGIQMMTNSDGLKPGEVRTSKTATPVTGKVNTWDITVRIEGRDDEKVETTDIVLVIDRSGSMDSNNRMTNAKKAAKDFIDAVIPADSNVRIAIVSFSSDYTNNGYTSKLVTIDHDFSKDQETLKGKVDDLRAHGGTHTQAGIIQGEELLDESDADNKYMVLLSDGQPTFSYEPSGWVTVSETLPGWYNESRGDYDYDNEYGNGDYNTEKVVGSGNTVKSSTTQPSGTEPDNRTWPYTSSGTQYYPLSRSGPQGGRVYSPIKLKYYDNGRAAIHASEDAKSTIDSSGGLFTIAVQAGDVGTPILRQIASPGMAHSTQDPEKLKEIYEEIKTQIQTQSALKNVVITDEMGDGFSIIGAVTTTEGETSVASPTGSNETITWTINPAVQNLVPGSENVRYAEMTYQVEINDDILKLDGAKKDESKLFKTNKETKMKYTNTADQRITKDIDSPEVDPVLLKIKKVLLDKGGNSIRDDSRTFEVKIDNKPSDTFNHTEELIAGEDYVWLTSLRDEGVYNVAEISITGEPQARLNMYNISYQIDKEEKETFKVNHIDGIPRGDVDIVVTNQLKHTTGVTIKKEVTGNFGDKQKIFHFEAKVTDANGDSVDYDITQPSSEAGYEIEGDIYKFDLKDGEEVTLAGLPVGSMLWLRETNPSDYRVTVTPVNNAPVDGWYEVPISDQLSITVINNLEVQIETGIHTNSLPFIAILAFSISGLSVIVISNRKYKTNADRR